MRAISLAAVAVACAVTSSGCSRELADVTRPNERQPEPVVTPAREVDALFQTDSLTYTLADNGTLYSAKIGIRFTNSTPTTTYIINCKGATAMRLEKLTDGVWKFAWSAIVQACLSGPIVTEPNATYETLFSFYAGHADANIAPKFQTLDVDGIYRIVWGDVHNVDMGDNPTADYLLPLPQRISNRFALRTKPGP